MSGTDQFKGTPFDQRPDIKTVPGILKVLTILTFIGCAIGLVGSIYNTINAKAGLDQLEKMQGSDQLEKMPDFAKKMFSPEAVQLARTSYENRIPLLIIGLVGIGLCLVGAIQMRSLKKQGYYLWLLGELLPLAGSVIFIGTAFLTGFIGIVSLVITGIFVILYSTTVKYLS
jgi:hypothetical protein